MLLRWSSQDAEGCKVARILALIRHTRIAASFAVALFGCGRIDFETECIDEEPGKQTVIVASGREPVAAIARDLDSDGRADLAIVDRAADQVEVLLGNADRSFSAHGPFATGSRPVALNAGDFDNAGQLDLVVINEGSNDISVLIGTGGELLAERRFAVGTSPSGVGVANFNGDPMSFVDLLVTNASSDDVYLLTNSGGATFTSAPLIVPGFASPTSIAIGDLDGSSIHDAAIVAQGSQEVRTLLDPGHPETSVRTLPVGWKPARVAVAYLNGDGAADLIVTDLGDGTAAHPPAVIVLRGQLPSFVALPALETRAPAEAFAVGDLDGDGINDLALAYPSIDAVGILIGIGDGAFGPEQLRVLAAGSAPRALAIGDFDGDMHADLAIIETGSDRVEVAYGQCTQRR